MSSATATGLACHMRREFADEFAISARLYAETVVILTRGMTTGQEFEQLRKCIQEARERMEAARLAFEQHVTSHGCGNPICNTPPFH